MDDEADNASITRQLRSNWSLDYLENLDTSEYPFPNTLWHIKPSTEITIKCTIMVFIATFGIILNSIILMIISKNRWLWTASNYLVGNMAIVDLLTLIFCPWFWLVRDFYQNFVLGNFGCRFDGFLQGTFLLAGVGAVILVSYDRLAAAALTAEAKITKKAAPKLICATWLFALVLSLPWIFKREYFEREWLDYIETYCVEDVTFLNVYWHIIITILVWVPLGLMFITYGAIMWRLERSAKKLKSHGGQTIGRARGKAMRITACVLVAATLCRLPYTIMVYWRNNLSPEINAADGAYSVVWFTANLLIYFNCAVNPLIYGFTNERFRRAMDRTPGVSCWKFGSWCCVCSILNNKKIQVAEDKNTEKIFVIESSPKQHKKIGYLIKNMLHIHKDSLELSMPKFDEVDNKVTKCTPLNV